MMDSLMLGPFHAADLVYSFDMHDAALAAPQNDERDIVDAMQHHWTRFTATGDPDGGSDRVWPANRTATDQHISLSSPPSVGGGHREASCDFRAGLGLP
jgi:carboxylesterase type B